ncbi:MAG: ABC transporter ATP-binding protein/permease [Candidatus Bathyarchaeota archaeon]|nr:ABC transporter ATP-binding protein/permease [Candidatus Bathyarchaeota archaeon]
MGFHYHHHHHGLDDKANERKTSSRILMQRLLKYFLPYKKLFAVVLFVTATTAITGVVKPYLLSKEIVSNGILTSDTEGLLFMVLAYIVVIGVNWISRTVRTYGIGKIGESILFKMRSDLFAHLQNLSFSFFDTSDSGDTISRVINDTDAIGEAFTSGVVQVISDTITLALTIIVLFSINVQLALASMLVIPLIIADAWAFNSRFRSAHRQTRTTISDVTSKLEEGISGIREIKSFTKESDTIKDFRAVAAQDFQANLQATKVFGIFFPTIQAIRAVGFGAVILYGGMLTFNGALGPTNQAIGTVLAFILYVETFFQPVFELTMFYNTVQSALAGAERIFELNDTKPEITDSKDAVEIPSINGEIAFEKVTFGYDPEYPVLHNVSFWVKPKETIALVGPTGAGKSTIIKLLSRFYEPQSGSIKVDGRDLKDATQKSVRNQMGIVLQDSFLFTGTIMENMRYGKLDATDEEVMNAAKIVGAHEFISNRPDGYNTEIGERGAGLSVGQKQLVSFARALLRDPALLILDEATSSIDPYTDLLIRKAMKILLKDRTSIIIAHRLSTVRNADRILVIDNGRIVEEGNHRALMKKGGLYKHLYDMQFKEPELGERPEVLVVASMSANPGTGNLGSIKDGVYERMPIGEGLHAIIGKFQEKDAISPEKAMTIKELDLPPKFEDMMKGRLGETGIFVEVEGKYYLSKERLKEFRERLTS